MSVTLSAHATQQFSGITVPSGGSVSWSISPQLGTITQAGLYTPPGSPRLGESVAVTAASGSVSAGATVHLTAPVSIVLKPGSAVLKLNGTQQFKAVVSGAVNTAVNWSLSPAIGNISASGVYSAPAAGGGLAITVPATSAADTAKSASARITILGAK
jgi:hypothetical protein